jgi:hypothetical protein
MARHLSGLDPEKYNITIVAVLEMSDDVVDFLPGYVTIYHPGTP